MIAAVERKPRRIRRAQDAAGLFDELLVDNFAGGGGASLGIERAVGRAVDLAVNHDRSAIIMHRTNHPRTLHLCENVWKVDPQHATGGRPVGLAWFSPDCKHFSSAKGGKPVDKRIRGLAWVVIKWARAVRPRVIILENVREFETWGPLTSDNRPCPDRKGQTFNRWVGCLRNLGYAIERRMLNAADYGAPTHRRRLFIIARCDGLPIAWPEPTHGPGRSRPWRTAAECIDWSLPCPSIFERKRPLAEKTMRRIAMGVVRYVLNDPKPFIVRIGHHGGNGHYSHSVEEPLRTIVSKNEHCLVIPHITHYYGLKGGETRASGVDSPLPTQPTENRFGLVTAFLAKHYGGVVGHGLDRPLGTITAKDHHSLVSACLIRNFYGQKQWNSVQEPLPTVTTQTNKFSLVAAFLIKYYGQGCGQRLAEPLHTVVSKDRFGFVAVQINGEPWVISDIGLRMLTPRELARCQGFPDDYELTGTASNQVAKIGNSVCPQVAEVLVGANYVETAERMGVA